MIEERPEDIAWLQLKGYANTNQQKLAIYEAIMNSVSVKEIYNNHKQLSFRQDKLLTQAQKHIQSALKALELMSPHKGFFNQNSTLIKCLEEAEVKKVSSKLDMVKANFEIICKGLADSGFSNTRIEEDIKPTLMQIVKGTL